MVDGYDPMDPFQSIASSSTCIRPRSLKQSGSKDSWNKRFRIKLKWLKKRWKRARKNIGPHSNILQWPFHIILSLLILSVDLLQNILVTVDTVRSIEWNAYYIYYKDSTINIVHQHYDHITDLINMVEWSKYYQFCVISILRFIEVITWRPETILLSLHREQMDETHKAAERAKTMWTERDQEWKQKEKILMNKLDANMTECIALKKESVMKTQRINDLMESHRVIVEDRKRREVLVQVIVQRLREQMRMKEKRIFQLQQDIVERQQVHMEGMQQQNAQYQVIENALKEKLNVKERNISDLKNEMDRLRVKHERKVQKLNRRYKISQNVIESQQEKLKETEEKLKETAVSCIEWMDEQIEETNDVAHDRAAWIWKLRKKEEENKEIEDKYRKCKVKLGKEENKVKEMVVKIERIQMEWRKKLEIKERDLWRLREEMEALKVIKQQMDVRNYRNWTEEQFVQWISNIDGQRFKRYEHELREAFLKEGVNGMAIPHINKLEWKGWGITLFKDRIDLDQHVRNLVDGMYSTTSGGGDHAEGQSTPYI